ncbi:M20/M25/M40 family metallo-hydrolase [Roseimaritima ulvae]|uniref:Carboxypeptidase G2 n=1 Tax=Roseimaritima ulvae TaxID=980254 RepID=A0A5B9QKN7_9BACT|nr:M20/M25/M40 family metallo-hydrolase [Roseimaritima ulvae]QEG38559.1 Carboxypeptidase G2 precursor [Roseimaritima ulvae]
MSATIDTDAALDRFLQLTAIPGPSGKEKAVAAEIVRQLEAAGADSSAIQFDDAHRRTRMSGEVGNLIVHLPGTVEGPTTLLTAHMDTVPVCVGSQPTVDGEYVYSAADGTGLGADNRAGCAALLTAACELLSGNQPYPPLVLCWFVQEEIGLEGSRNMNAQLIGPHHRAINFDGGTVEKLTIGAIGGERMTIDVQGIASHAGVAPEQGASAIVMASEAIASLHRDGWLGYVRRPQGGEGRSNIGVFQGGDATNVVTPHVHLRAEARSHDPEVRTAIVSAIRDAFESAAAEVQNADGQGGRITFSSHVDYEAFCLDEQGPSVSAAQAAVSAVGREPLLNISNGGLDANWMFRHGIQAVTLGCGQRNVHTADERLCIPDYLDACRIATAVASGQTP